MKRTIRLRESELRHMIAESVKTTINEWYNDGDYEQIDLDGSVIENDAENGEIYAANLWFENNTIVVRWVENNDNGADMTSDLLNEDPAFIWEILKSIKN